MKTFLKKDQIQLINGGYLTNKDTQTPVTNEDFVVAQKSAEWVCTFAKMAQGKDFKGKPADSLQELKQEVYDLLYAKKTVEYVGKPVEPENTITETLKNEALAFIKYQEKVDHTEAVNNFLQKFNVINEFETNGLFFKQGIVKMNNIYTMEEIVNAVKSVIDLL